MIKFAVCDDEPSMAQELAGHLTRYMEERPGVSYSVSAFPEGYDEMQSYPTMVLMPGYDRMWFGQDSAGRNVERNSFQAWQGRGMIVVSAQLTDRREKSVRQTVELTEYMMEHFAVGTGRVYAACVHRASQWDGTYGPAAENQVAAYIFIAENDEYYGSQKARTAYDSLLSAHRETGLSGEEIEALLRLQIPDNVWFNQRGIYNCHGGGSVMFDEEDIISWVLEQEKRG